jgi:asparagine synthase (glutamine-hydrolysing)
VSGIVGLYRPDGPDVDADAFREQWTTLDHRGPDGRGKWIEGQVGLGHHQLLATPEAAGETQPIGDGDRMLTADARIDNRAVLLSELGLPPEASDAELILAAYDRWHVDCPEQLVGAFAFALWDGQEQQLFLARDHMGVKPL